MRITISLLLVSLAFSTLAQRISFDDPDLSFSFKKPKSWQIFDDGYQVKASPSAADSGSYYFAITYFESPKPFGEMSLGLATSFSLDNLKDAKFKIAREEVKYENLEGDQFQSTKYYFYKFGQRFEISLTHESMNKKKKRRLLKIAKSIKVNSSP